jgi:hypothetical protein
MIGGESMDLRFVGKSTIERMKKTRYFALANFISELRYNLSDTNDDHYRIQKKTYLGTTEEFEYAKIDSKYVDSNKALKLIEEELEGLALLEVTK